MVVLIKFNENGIRRAELKISLKQQEDQSYPIIIENGALPKIPADLKERGLGDRFAIITDSNVSLGYGTAFEAVMRGSGFRVRQFVFPAGEQNKRLRVCENIANEMSANGFGRDTTIIALGGGVVGDMAGFIASAFNRGVPYIQIPTTLVAQADSSIGGKTGVDTEFGKNLFGAFKQPVIVYIDPLTLRTLPAVEYSCGLAETTKHGIIQDANFFDYLEQNVERILVRDEEVLVGLAETNCRIKGNVVEIDPKEKGLRRILNLGHTVGHAIESLGAYTIPHGYCVSMGILPALRIAVEKTGFQMDEIVRVEKLLRAFSLPTKIPPSISNDDIIKMTTLDKKAAKGQARYCLAVSTTLTLFVVPVFYRILVPRSAQDRGHGGRLGSRGSAVADRAPARRDHDRHGCQPVGTPPRPRRPAGRVPYLPTKPTASSPA